MDPRKFVFPAQEDARIQEAVLATMLAKHPSLLTVSDVIYSSGDFTDQEASRRAIYELIAAGLLLERAGFLSVTRAPLHFDQLGMSDGFSLG